MSDYFSTSRLLIDGQLRSIAAEARMPAVLMLPVSRALSSPGKRIRGILTLAAAETFGLGAKKALDAAAAFEMIHTSSLILDDLPVMDDAELRRGEPALHRSSGEDLAILTAVALLNHSYGLIARSHGLAAPRRWKLDVMIDRVVAAVGWDGSVGGEAVDLHSDASTLDFSTLEYIHSRKTGALFVAAGEVGAMLANGSVASVNAIGRYAKNLGLAFQISDDILDATSSAETLGKDVGKDAGKLTFVKLAGVDGARKLAGELIDASLDAVSGEGARGERLRQLAGMVRDRVR